LPSLGRGSAAAAPRGGAMSDPMKFLMDELKADDTQMAVRSITNLRTIALAMGEEKCRNELLPALDAEVKGGPHNQRKTMLDDVMVSIAEVLGCLVDFVGGPKWGHLLLPTLEYLCTVEETTVRDQAVKSINQVGKEISHECVTQYVAPIAFKLAETMDWFTPRVSACGLFALSYRAAPDEEMKKKLRARFLALCQDETPMVRRAAAAQLSDFAAEVKSEVKTELLEEYMKLLKDDQDSVRVKAIKCTDGVLAHVPAADKIAALDACWFCVTDKSWRVRVACAETIAAAAAACEADCKVNKDLADKLKKIYKTLQDDSEQEVRCATARKAGGTGAALGPEFATCEIYPVVKQLMEAPEGTNMPRVELAAVIMDLAAPMGKANAVAQLLEGGASSMIGRLTKEDEQTNVRLTVINKLVELIHVVGIDNDAGRFITEQLIRKLAADKNWRIRHATLLLLPSLAQDLGPAKFEDLYTAPESGGFESRATDNCALIRTDWAAIVAKVAVLPGFGGPWLSSVVVPILVARSTEKVYQLLSVSCEGLKVLAGLMLIDDVKRLTEIVLGLADHKVANLRIQAVIALRAAIPPLSADESGASMLASVKSKLESKVSNADEDPDVRWFSEQGLAAI